MKLKKDFDASLYVITDNKSAGRKSIIDVVRQAIQGGATIIQLRDKNASDEEMIIVGKELLKITKREIPLIINDNVKVAIAIGAQGIHVGQKDMPALKAKKMINGSMILGVSANTVREAIMAEKDGADYIGAGPVFPTSTKPDADPAIGLNGLRNIKKAVSIPVVAIGGINSGNAEEVMKIADGMAVVSAIMAADDPERATEELSKIIKKNEAFRSEAAKCLRNSSKPPTLLRQGFTEFSSPSSSQQAAKYSAKENNFMEKINIQAGETLSKIRKQKPLIHHITNFVVMNDTANITIHLGASPVMAHAREEMKEMTAIADALVLNIGTLTKYWVESMIIAGKAANKKGIPIILDAVGAGATTYRTKTCRRLIKNLHISVIKGNAGEIGILSGAGGKVKGVESVEEADNLASAIKNYAIKTKAVVIATGKRDIVSDGKNVYGIDNGNAWLSAITGSGCMATATIGAFCAVEHDYALASVEALACFGLAAELAARKIKGPASFKIALLDAVYNMNEKTLAKGAKIIRTE
jgi:thiamine-phosphate diphosphorylase/hydroxyethylthiazole kinase